MLEHISKASSLKSAIQRSIRIDCADAAHGSEDCAAYTMTRCYPLYMMPHAAIEQGTCGVCEARIIQEWLQVASNAAPAHRV